MPPVGLVAGSDAGLYYGESDTYWDQILSGGVRNVITLPGGPSWPMSADFIVVVTQAGRLLISEGVWCLWNDETGDLPGIPVDVVYSDYDQSLYVCTESHGVFRTGLIPTALAETPAAKSLALSAWPNPFNPATQFSIALPTSGRITLSVYDAEGRRVATLADGEFAAGMHNFAWQPADLPSGVYLARLSGDFGRRSLRTVLLK